MTAGLEPSVILRAAELSDAPALASLLGELGYPSAVADVRARLTRLLAAAADDVIVAVRPPTEVLGLLSLHRFAAIHATAEVAMIAALVVAEGARGAGVGRRLVERAEAIAHEHGCAHLMVTTHVRRADAHTFYERLGFELTGRRYVKALG